MILTLVLAVVAPRPTPSPRPVVFPAHFDVYVGPRRSWWWP